MELMQFAASSVHAAKRVSWGVFSRAVCAGGFLVLAL